MSCFSDNKGTLFQYFATIIANLMGIANGMATAWSAPMIPYFLGEKSHITMTENEAEWLENSFVLGGLVGIPITAFLLYKIGPKKSILVAVVLKAFSWIVVAISKEVSYIYAVRAIMGAALNTAYISAPMYVGEIAHKKIRGFLSSNVYLMALSGQIVMYVIGPFVSFIVPSIVAVVILTAEFVIFSFLPESPYFLISKQRKEEARYSLQKFRGNTNIDDELNEMIAGIEADQKEKFNLKEIFTVKNYRKALIIMIFLELGQPFSSFEVLLMNLHEILNSSGSEYLSTTTGAIIFAVITFIAAATASILLDKFGRKKLLMISSFLAGTCILFLSIYFNLKYIGYDVKSIDWIPMYSVFLFAAFNKFGIGLVPIVITAEIFATKVKSFCMTFADAMYMIGVFLALQLFFFTKNTLGMHAPFYFFSCCSFCLFFFVTFYVPETKGKTMEEIQRILRGEKIKSNKNGKINGSSGWE